MLTLTFSLVTMLNAPFEVVVLCVLMLLVDASATALHHNIFLQI